MSRTVLLEELESIKFPLAHNRHNIKRKGNQLWVLFWVK